MKVVVIVVSKQKYHKIGERLKNYRIRSKMSQAEVSRGICSRQTISLLESGQHVPSAQYMSQIAQKLNVPLKELISEDIENLDLPTSIEIIGIYVQSEEYHYVLSLLDRLLVNERLLKYQQYELNILRAECLIRTGKAKEAVKILEELQNCITEAQGQVDDVMTAILNDKFGTAYYFLSDAVKSHHYYSIAYQSILRFSEFNQIAARITYNLGMISRELNRNTEAIVYISRAIEFFREKKELNRLAHASIELGIAYKNSNNYENAKQFLKQALVIYQQLEIPKMERMVRQNYASVILAEKSSDQSIIELKKCAEDYKRAGDRERLCFSYSRLACILVSQYEYSEASKYLEFAFHILSHCSIRDAFKAFLFRANAVYLFGISDFEGCLEYSFKSIRVFSELGITNEAEEVYEMSKVAYDYFLKESALGGE